MLWEYAVGLSFIIIELLAPRHSYKFIREGFFEDLFYFLMVAWAIPRIHEFFPWGFDLFRRHAILDLSRLSWFVQFCIALIIMDFLRWGLHLAMHRNKILWLGHKLHHSTSQLTTLSSYRTGYWEEICLILFNLIPLSFIIFSESVFQITVTIFALHGYLLHSNIALEFPKGLKILASPHFHQWHHSDEQIFKGGQNFGATLTVWDKLFRTYHCPKENPVKLGLSERDKMEGNAFTKFFYPLFTNFWK